MTPQNPYIYVRLIVDLKDINEAEKEIQPILSLLEEHGQIKYLEKGPYWKIDDTCSITFLLLKASDCETVFEKILQEFGNHWHVTWNDPDEFINEVIWNRSSEMSEKSEFLYNSKISWCNFRLDYEWL